jgi:hypothetical protein
MCREELCIDRSQELWIYTIECVLYQEACLAEGMGLDWRQDWQETHFEELGED